MRKCYNWGMMINDTPNEESGVPDDLPNWEPSIRAAARSNSYEEYLELMAQFTKELENEL